MEFCPRVRPAAGTQQLMISCTGPGVQAAGSLEDAASPPSFFSPWTCTKLHAHPIRLQLTSALITRIHRQIKPCHSRSHPSLLQPVEREREFVDTLTPSRRVFDGSRCPRRALRGASGRCCARAALYRVPVSASGLLAAGGASGERGENARGARVDASGDASCRLPSCAAARASFAAAPPAGGQTHLPLPAHKAADDVNG